jgi:hypothetical protein
MDRRFLTAEPAAADTGHETGKSASMEDCVTKWHVYRRDALQRGLLRRFSSSGFALISFCLLSGCIDSYLAVQAPQAPPPQPNNMARREGVSPSGVTVALASFAGGPEGMRDRFSRAFGNAAKAQDIVMATPDAADYLVRGYLNAVLEEDGTALTYVLDIFDAKKRRTQRVEDHILLKAKAADPWSVVDDSALSAVAAKSAAALAAVLTNTPEAILASAQMSPANGGMSASAAAYPEEDGRTIVAATPPVGPAAAPSTGGLESAVLH